MKRTKHLTWAAAASVAAALAILISSLGPAHSPRARGDKPATALAATSSSRSMPHVSDYVADVPNRVLPSAVDRVQRYLERHPLSHDTASGLTELMRLAGEMRANPIGRESSPAENTRYLERQRAFRLRVRDVLEGMTPTQRMALYRSRLSPMQLARVVNSGR